LPVRGERHPEVLQRERAGMGVLELHGSHPAAMGLAGTK
jgi:hypothetical protein